MDAYGSVVAAAAAEDVDWGDAAPGIGAPDVPAAAAAGKRGVALASTLFLAACGAEKAESPAVTPSAPTPAPAATPSPSTPVVVAPAAPPTASEASRFLAQTTFGATRAEIDKVSSRGYAGWLDDQIALPRATTYWDWLKAGGFDAAANIYQTSGFDPMVWSQIISAPDQLRQRVMAALLDIFVVGIDSLTSTFRAFNMAAYMDVLADNAFGNYRALMGAVTLSPAMANYLTYLDNRKANATTGAMPDENYARELMQLFTLGLYRLNIDGSVQTANGAGVDVYTQSDVTQLARVFTGLQYAGTADGTVPDRYRLPLKMTAGMHEAGSSTVLGSTINGADGMGSINAALDVIFAHPNMPPFVARSLIQRLVSSNPSAAYIARVASVFADNGKGVRGDLAAVVRAIVLDVDARGAATLTAAGAGKLRDPVQRLTGWARMFGVTSPSNAWQFGDTSSTTSRLGQSIGHAPSVFNFFRPGYTPPATTLASAGMVAPEMQISNEQSTVAYVNYMYSLIANGAGDMKADYAAIKAMAGDSAALVGELNTVLAAGQLSADTVASIRAAVDSISMTAGDGAINRVGVAVLLTMASPDYLTLR